MKKYILIAIIMTLVVGLGVFILGMVGETFIREVVQEVKVDEGNGVLQDVHIGAPAPSFTLRDLDGKEISPFHFLGSPVLLTFWNTWNSVSIDQIAIFDEYSRSQDESLFKIIAINNQESKSVVSQFMKRGGYKIRVLLDELGDVGEIYRIQTLPVTYFLDKEGVVKDVVAGVLSERMFLERIEKIIR